jgi:epoxyqueuosine reductase
MAAGIGLDSATVKRHALAVGFDTAGVSPLRTSDHAQFYRAWLAAGRHGEMSYLARPDAVQRRLDPVAAWPRLKSAIVVGLNYAGAEG